jgi:hypothetical protein
MKYLFTPMLLLILFGCKTIKPGGKAVGSAQNPTIDGNKYTYSYDFSDRSKWKEDDTKIPIKARVSVHIENINTLAYNITSTVAVSAIALEKNNIFDSLASSLSGANTTGGPKAAVARVATLRAEFNAPYDELINLLGQINTNYQALRGSLATLQQFSFFCQSAQVQIGSECCSQPNLLKSVLANPFLKGYDATIRDLDALLASISTQPAQFVDNISNLSAKLVDEKKQADKDLDDLTNRCNVPATADANVCPQLNDLKTKYPADLQKVLDQSAKISKDTVNKAVVALQGLITQIKDPNNFRYYLDSIYPAGDFVNVSVNMQPKPSSSVRTDNFSLKLKVRGRFEWSVGPSLNFGFIRGSFDESYSIDTSRSVDGTPKTDTFTITKNSLRSTIGPSIGVMTHFYWQNHTNLTPGIGVGISTSVNDLSNLKAYLGVSLLIGGFDQDNNKNLVYNRLILSAGIAYGMVNRLKGNLHEGENPKFQIPFTGNDIAKDQLADKVGRIGLFFGVTYKLN